MRGPLIGLTGLVLAAAVLAGCGQTAPAPVDVVESYVGAVGEGNFTGACSSLDHHAIASLETAMASNQPCSTLLARCFPSETTLLRKDQTQLLYATVDISVRGSRAEALTGGTLVAKAVKEVSLLRRAGQWSLDSYGEERCLRFAHRPLPARRRR